jgi:hypothetical protein
VTGSSRGRAGLGRLAGIERSRRGGPASRVRSHHPPATSPHLAALHAEVARRWGTIELLDFLKEADFYTRFTDAFSSVATRETTPRPVIRKRLLLVLHSLGINIGIKRIAAAGNHGETEATLRATRALFVNRDNLRNAVSLVVNETLKARDPL